MTKTRPIALSLRELDRVERLQQLAASTAAHIEGLLENAPRDENGLRLLLVDAAFADGVAAVLAWLGGAEPTPGLVNLLEL